MVYVYFLMVYASPQALWNTHLSVFECFLTLDPYNHIHGTYPPPPFNVVISVGYFLTQRFALLQKGSIPIPDLVPPRKLVITVMSGCHSNGRQEGRFHDNTVREARWRWGM